MRALFGNDFYGAIKTVVFLRCRDTDDLSKLVFGEVAVGKDYIHWIEADGVVKRYPIADLPPVIQRMLLGGLTMVSGDRDLLTPEQVQQQVANLARLEQRRRDWNDQPIPRLTRE